MRAVISLDTFVLSEHEISVLDQVSFTGEQIDPNDFPGMIGYIVQPGDNLWSIAKKYRMSIERIREVNQDNTKADSLMRLLPVCKKKENLQKSLAQSQDKSFCWCDKRIVIGNIRMIG